MLTRLKTLQTSGTDCRYASLSRCNTGRLANGAGGTYRGKTGPLVFAEGSSNNSEPMQPKNSGAGLDQSMSDNVLMGSPVPGQHPGPCIYPRICRQISPMHVSAKLMPAEYYRFTALDLVKYSIYRTHWHGSAPLSQRVCKAQVKMSTV